MSRGNLTVKNFPVHPAKGINLQFHWVQKDQQSYIELIPVTLCLVSEQDALDCVGVCGEYGTQRLMIHASNLAPGFFNLKTGLAGQILLKFSIYSLKVAAVVPPEIAGKGRFGEMVYENNRVNQEFRVFPTHQEAESWLLL